VILQGPTPQPPLLPTPGLDPNFVAGQLIPMIGIVAVIVVGALVLRWFFRSPVAEAIAERIRARTRSRFGGDAATGEIEGERVHQLEQQVATLQSQLAEVAERVDFAERLLAERRERKLSAGQ
jgi:hypothetical protein